MTLPKGQTRPKLPTVPCHGPGCDNPVRQTRPSVSGRHYCRNKDCQRAKQRELYRERVQREAGGVVDQLIVERANLIRFLEAVSTRERVPCPQCGLTTAIRGYAHRSQEDMPCYGIGTSVLGVGPEEIDAVWPAGTREYGPVEQ